MTEVLYREDPYLRECEVEVRGVNERGGITLDRTVCYVTGGGQPGDKAVLTVEGCEPLRIATTVYGEHKQDIVHVPANQDNLPAVGAKGRLVLDWDSRYRHMRVHTCMHLLCSLVPFPVTGGQIAADGGRLDFDISDPDKVNKDDLTRELQRLVAEDHRVSERWITDDELADKPELVRTMSVKPPMGSGKVRLVQIGTDGQIDLQPCGGTHVKSTSEIGAVAVAKIENKGKQNRRIRIALQ